MHGTAAWLLAAVAVAVLVVGGTWLLWVSRTSTLTNRVGSFDCALAADVDGPWRAGIAQYGRVRMYWWRRASIAPRAAAAWQRAGIVVVERRPGPPPEALPSGESLVVVRCRVVTAAGSQTVCLRMTPEAYAGFTSWIEATPTAVGSVI